jgi:hypothetical protein
MARAFLSSAARLENAGKTGVGGGQIDVNPFCHLRPPLPSPMLMKPVSLSCWPSGGVSLSPVVPAFLRPQSTTRPQSFNLVIGDTRSVAPRPRFAPGPQGDLQPCPATRRFRPADLFLPERPQRRAEHEASAKRSARNRSVGPLRRRSRISWRVSPHDSQLRWTFLRLTSIHR